MLPEDCSASRQSVRVGCAGWSIPKQAASQFIGAGSHLNRYSKFFKLLRDQFIFLPFAQARDVGALGQFRWLRVPILSKTPENNYSCIKAVLRFPRLIYLLR